MNDQNLNGENNQMADAVQDYGNEQNSPQQEMQ